MRQADERIQKEEFHLAEPLLRQALRKEPGNVETLYRLGYVQYRQRNLFEARQNFGAVVRSAPPANHSRYFLGRIALLESKPLDAIQWLEPVVSSGQTILDASSQLANAYAAAGQLRKALALLRAAIAEAPWESSLYYRLGRLYQGLAENELAKEAFDNSARLKNSSREDVETLMGAAQAAGDGRTAEAIQLGARILDRADAEPNALVALGVIYGHAKLQTEALRAFERAAQCDAEFFQAHFNYGLALLKLGRSAEAMAPLLRALDLLPQSLEANKAYGLASVMSQRYSEAIGPLERAWRMDSSDARVGALLATAYLRTNAARKAAPLLREASSRSTADPSPVLLLVEALNAIEDTNGALDAARLAQKRFPSLPQAHLALAQQLVRLGRYEEARPEFEQVLKLAPGRQEAELGLADTLQKAGEHAAAAGHYRAVMQNPATSLAARVGLARSLVALGQLDSARQVLEEGVAGNGSDIALRLELTRVYARLGRPDLAAQQAKLVELLRAAPASDR